MCKLLKNKVVWLASLGIVLTVVITFLTLPPSGVRLSTKYDLVLSGMSKAEVVQLMTEVGPPVFEQTTDFVLNGTLQKQTEIVWDDGLNQMKVVFDSSGTVHHFSMGESGKVSRLMMMILEHFGW